MSMDLLARLAAASAQPMTATPAAQAEASARNPMDEITSDPSVPTAPKMGLLDTLRIDDGVTPAIKPPDAQPNVSPTEPALPEPEPVVEKPKRGRGRPPKATPPAEPNMPVGTVLLPLVEANPSLKAVECILDETAQAEDSHPPEMSKDVVETLTRLRAEAQEVKFVYEAPKSLDIKASDFDLELFVESVCEKASKADDLEVQLQAARIAVDLLAVRKQ